MTDKELEQQIEKELGFRIDESNMFSDGWKTDKRHWQLWQSLLSARQEVEEKKDAILQSAAKMIEQSKEIERLQRVEFELRRQLESRPESEHTGVADMERFQRSLEASRISDEEIQMAATKATVTEDGYINLHGARMFELGAKWLRERLGK